MIRLRNGLRGLVTAIPDSGLIDSPKDLQRALGISYKLAWQVQRIATASDPVAEATHVPGVAAFRKFLQRTEAKQGVPRERLAAAQAAVAEFDAMVRTHAGSRAAFDAMMSGISGTADRIEVNQRKAAYRANSHIWGVQVRARMACIIISPNEEDPMRVDLVMVRGVVGVNQLRHGRPFVVSSAVHLDNRNVIECNPEIEQLGEMTGDMNLLRRYCSEPIPMIRNRMTDDGKLVTEIVNRDIGVASAFTGFFCDIFRRSDVRYRDDSNTELVLGSTIQYPTEVNVIDAFIRRGTYSSSPLRFRSESRSLLGIPEPYACERDVLFVDDDIEYLGRGTGAMHCADYPQYADMIGHVMDRIGWAAHDFEAYRHRQMYPVMPSAVVTILDLPEPPTNGR